MVRAWAPLAAGLFVVAATAAPVTPDELATLCANAEDASHCGRLVEAEQLRRLPHLATRDGLDLKVTLYPSGATTFTDVEAPTGGRSHSLWDFISEINVVVLYSVAGDEVSFTLLQRTNGRKFELPAEPKVAPDRQRLVTADFCATHCVNELAVWRIARDGIVKEAAWKPAAAWTDAVATWKDAETIRIEYTAAGAAAPKFLERRLSEPSWSRVPAR